MIYWDELEVYSDKYLDVLDITDEVEKIVKKSGIRNGYVIIHNPKPTSALTINEHDEDLWEDFLNTYTKLVPPHQPEYKHDAKYKGWKREENTHGHFLNTFIGSNVLVLIRNRELVLGTWQRILYLEFDGFKKVKLVVQVFGE